MKFIASFILTLILTVALGRGTPQEEMNQRIKNSLRSGNARELTTLFDRDVELVIDSEKVDFNKIGISQAEQILKSFFKKRPPREFQFVYQGGSASVRYSTGTYWSGTDAFLVYILIKKSGSQYFIETIHFRKEINPRTASVLREK